MTFADIIIDINHPEVDKIFQYKIPQELEGKVNIGSRVQVPFGRGNRLRIGYVVDLSGESNYDISKTKSIAELIPDNSKFYAKKIELANWMKERYYCTLSACLNLFFPKDINEAKRQRKIEKQYVVLNSDFKDEDYKGLIAKNARRQWELLYYIQQVKSQPLKAIDFNKYSKPALKALLEKKVLEIIEKEGKVLLTGELPKTLMPEQKNAVDTIVKDFKDRKGSSFLLHGITGSGKTEVYMQVIQQVLEAGQQVIVLVPEIGLTPQTVERFTKRFPGKVGVTHSRLNQTERAKVWLEAQEGEISIVLGPRSALFAPFQNIGLIVIDEEHESSYKSDSNPKYHTKEVALKMCELFKATCIFGTATPDLESYYNAELGIYKKIVLKNRAMENQLPKINIVDMREELISGNKNVFSRQLVDAIAQRLSKNEQIILFLNRRGHSTFVSCRKCGLVLKCDKCNLPFTYHASNQQMICHHCGQSHETIHECPECHSKYIRYFGVGTQKIEQHIHKIFPEARILRMDADTTRKKNAHEKIYGAFKNREADILIGTQMIAKGLDFPFVTLVGVVAADVSLNTDDFRAAEKTFQLLTQVAGRSGRGNLPGEVYIQTYTPDHYALKSVKSQDYVGFYQEEIAYRELMNYPPFSNFSTFLVQGFNETSVIRAANEFSYILKYFGDKRDIDVIGPAPAVLSKINNTFRWRVTTKHEDYELLKKYSLYCLKKFKPRDATISILMDMNPYTMM